LIQPARSGDAVKVANQSDRFSGGSPRRNLIDLLLASAATSGF
jgi:hypothetical protein